jgi:hypothetical protein
VYFMVDVPPDVRASSSLLDRELTRDDDCAAEMEGSDVHERLAVVVGLDEQRLNRVRIQDPTWRGQFRCVSQVAE